MGVGRGVTRFDPAGAIIPVLVELEGDVTQFLTMAVDTGATYVILPWRVAEALGHDPATARQRVEITTASGVERVPLITIRSIRVAGETVQHVPALVHDLPPQSRVDGLLGLSFLRHFRVLVDFQDGRLELIRI